MATRNQIINMSLSHLGIPPVSDTVLDDDTTTNPAAVQGILWIEQTRDEVLSAYPWTFATIRMFMNEKMFYSVSKDAFLNDWLYAFEYPDYCIQMQYITDKVTSSTTRKITSTPFSVEQNPDLVSTESERIVLCNLPEAVAVFTTNNFEWEDLPPHFIQPLTVLLGSYMSYSLTKDLELKAQLGRLYVNTLNYYTSQDANQVVSKDPQESITIQARGT